VWEVTAVPRPWVFLHLAIMAALVGFGEIAAAAVDIAKILFFVFAALFVIRLYMGSRSA
jgi:uncharacterized membrane protein YtjA (UPF0391 family)